MPFGETEKADNFHYPPCLLCLFSVFGVGETLESFPENFVAAHHVQHSIGIEYCEVCFQFLELFSVKGCVNHLVFNAVVQAVAHKAYTTDVELADDELAYGFGIVADDENGVEYKTFNVKDGHGLVKMTQAGFITAIITARNNGTVEHRAKNLHITELYQGQKNKLPALEELLKKYNLTYDEVSYMGDDLPDICCLEKVGLACCPNDAVDEVKKICHFVSSKDGGRGAVRELCDLILESQGIKKIYTEGK